MLPSCPYQTQPLNHLRPALCFRSSRPSISLLRSAFLLNRHSPDSGPSYIGTATLSTLAENRPVAQRRRKLCAMLKMGLSGSRQPRGFGLVVRVSGGGLQSVLGRVQDQVPFIIFLTRVEGAKWN